MKITFIFTEPMMKSLAAFLMLGLLVFCASSCGQKGPLYLPEPISKQPKAPS